MTPHHAAFFGELNEPVALRVLIGSDDWPDSIVEACAELLKEAGPRAILWQHVTMPPWIN